MDGTLVKIIGLVAGACTSCALIPQVVQTIKTKKASDVSIFMFIVMLTGNALWVIYGLMKSDIAIILTNLVTVGLNITMLFLKFKYKENK
ncbi:MAG: SemiSWEET family sugar transporter [Janthinobacterium lividum]